MEDLRKRIVRSFKTHRAMVNALLADDDLVGLIERAALTITEALCAGGTVFTFGNGGSAADAQHIAAELVGRFKVERRGIPAVALVTDGAAMTALANDFGYEDIFARQLEALGRLGDVAIAISTSGKSPSVLRGVERAREIGMTVIGLTGGSGGELAKSSDITIVVPSDDTPVIQEGHVMIYHVLCGLIEEGVCARTQG